jgi:ATP-dependent exoDNAse (exonuclease V) beta subunit
VNAVRILTIHKSKGLAFNVVVMPYLNMAIDHPGFRQPNMWVENNWPEVEEKTVSIKYSSDLLKTYYSDQYLKERIHVAMDSLNTLYVAFTRPKFELIAFIPQKKTEGNTRLNDFLLSAVSQPNLFGSNENEIDLSSFWNAETSEFLIDLNHQDIVRTGNQSDDLVSFQYTQISSDWRSKISFISSENEFQIQTIQALNDKVAYGKLMHQIMAKINYADEIDVLMTELYSENLFSTELINQLKPKLEAYVSDKQVAQWYERNWEVLNEQGIITQNGELKIPDRMLRNREKYVIIDYKFAFPQPEHKQQVAEYIEMVKNMQTLPVEGYLYYPESSILMKIEV